MCIITTMTTTTPSVVPFSLVAANKTFAEVFIVLVFVVVFVVAMGPNAKARAVAYYGEWPKTLLSTAAI